MREDYSARGTAWEHVDHDQARSRAYRWNVDGSVPALPPDSPFQHDAAWRDLLLFHEYFHAETRLGLGAMHQTGWTGLVANLVSRKYRDAIPAYWRERSGQVHHEHGNDD